MLIQVRFVVVQPSFLLLPKTLEEFTNWMVRWQVQRGFVFTLLPLFLLSFYVADFSEDNLKRHHSSTIEL